MSQRARYLAIACASALVSGCVDVMGPDWEWGESDCWFICNPAVDYALSPDSVHMLRGDTASFYTWSCAANSLCLEHNVQSSWVIAGEALETIGSDGRPAPISGTLTTILVRAVAVGHSDITATAVGNPSNTRTVRAHVADSSVIASIKIVNFGTPLTSVKVGESFPVAGFLYDALGTHYRARVTDWSSSDSTVLDLGPPLSPVMGQRSVIARKAGTAEIRARFLDVTAVMRLTVVP